MRSCCDISSSGTDAPSNGRGAGGGRDLYGFLRDAELDHYYMAMTHSLKVTGLAQLKYVADDDLAQVGMTKPEVRRLRKRFRRECPQSAVERLCRRLAAARGVSQQHRQSPHRAPTLAIDECDAATAAAVLVAGSDNECMIPNQQLQVGRLLGEGDFARVHQAVWRPAGDRGQRLQVAAKLVDRARLLAVAETDASGGDAVKHFLREAAITMSVNHPSVARLFGVCAIGDDCLALVTELAPLRSLLECVREPALRATFHPAVLCDLAQQVAEGMSHLENRRIIHRDLAARNVLVFSRQRVKIGDTGISRALSLGNRHYGANLSPSLKLSAAWCAPECFKRPPDPFTSASDAWSFSVLLWEMFTYGFQPWAGLTGRQILTSLGEPQLCRLGRPDACPAAHYALMLRCWALEPARRPTFAELAAHLPKIIPERVVARRDSEAEGGESLHFCAGDTILVLDKAAKAEEPDACGSGVGGDGADDELWRGIRLDGGGSGLFRPNLMRSEQLLSSSSATSADDVPGGQGRRALRYSPEMISRPHDPQHIGHIGIDGTVFGDIAKHVAQTPGAKVPGEGAKQAAVPEEDEFRLDIGSSLVDEVLQAWSICSGSGNGGSSSGDPRRSSVTSTLSSDVEASATAAAIATQHNRREDSAVVSAASSVSSLAVDEPATSSCFHRVVDRPRCSSMVLVPQALGALHTLPQRLPAPTSPPVPEPGRSQNQQQQQQVQHLVNHHQHQQQQHATLRSLRTTEAFRAPPGGRPPPKPVRPVVRPEEPGSPWGSAFNVNRPMGANPMAEAGSTGSVSSQRQSVGAGYTTTSNAYKSGFGQQPENQEYEEIINL